MTKLWSQCTVQSISFVNSLIKQLTAVLLRTSGSCSELERWWISLPCFGPNPVPVQALALISEPQASLPPVTGRDDKTGLPLSHPAEEICLHVLAHTRTCTECRMPTHGRRPCVLIRVELRCFRPLQHKMNSTITVFYRASVRMIYVKAVNNMVVIVLKCTETVIGLLLCEGFLYFVISRKHYSVS